MRTKILKSMVLLFCLALFTYCGDKNDAKNCANTTIAAEVQTETNAVSNAALAYANDPSTANCNAYKDAYEDLIDAYKDLEDCAAAINQLDAWRQALDAAEAALVGLC